MTHASNNPSVDASVSLDMSLDTVPGAILEPLTASMLPAHGGQLRAIAQHFGIPAGQLVDFSASINPDGPPATVLSALRQALHDPATLTVYPDLEYTAFKQVISRHASVASECISIANGFVPLLRAALHAKKIRRCLLPVPAFGEYRHSLQQAGIAVIPYLLEPRGFVYETAAMLDALVASLNRIPATRCDAILLANPQNPSGVLTSAANLLELALAAAAHGITVFLDEAFIDYAPLQSLIQQAVTQPNLIVFRSVTKFFAIPGLRVAYAVSHPTQIAAMAQALPPWPVSTLDSLAATAALGDKEYAEQARQGNLTRRVSLQRQLEILGLTSYPSSANFLLLRLPPLIEAQALRERLIREEHLVVRACDSFEKLPLNHIRVAVRSEQENKLLLSALDKMLRV